MAIRVRFAPSPTGHVHIGNIRAAIFNWLLARHDGGRFLLRVEDTDRERSTPEATRTLLDVMAWLGLDYDEPPVYQSARLTRHLEVAELLLQKGAAYRENKESKGACVVFRMPREGRIEYDDLVKGHLRKNAEDTKDFVLVRSDGHPVFHLANVVDDIDMRITHIIRGDDHVENTFKHIPLFLAIGAEPPQYGHLPMIVNNQGKPYSKRDGAAFVGEFREQGFLPDALFNFLALLGWAPDDGRELFARADLVAAFSLDRCKSSAARFDMKKLVWMNGEYIRQLPRERFAAEFSARVRAGGLWRDDLPPDALSGLMDQIQPRTKIFSEIPGNCAWFLTDDYPLAPQAVEKRLKPAGVPELLEEVAGRFASLSLFDAAATEGVLREMGVARGVGLSGLVHPVRVAVSGQTEGPGLFELLALLGRARSCERLRHIAKRLRDNAL